MYLTRMRLNESNPNTAKALASPHIFHGTVDRPSESSALSDVAQSR